jgi:tripartite-type tricarboxylate transporter receptor subunit TctC
MNYDGVIRSPRERHIVNNDTITSLRNGVRSGIDPDARLVFSDRGASMMGALRVSLVALLLAAGGAQFSHARAQPYPAKPVRLVVPFPPSGGNDVFARLLAQKLSEAWKQQVLVENRPGAGGNLGTEFVARAAPDGYTLLLGHTGTLAINPALYAKTGYDPQRDFAPIALLASAPLVLVVNPGSALRSVGDIVAMARAKPGELNYASSGSGTGSHLSAELLQAQSGIRLTHVPYKGTSPAITDVLGGQVPMMFSVIPTALPQIRAGKLRAVAVTGARRMPQLPEVPTVAESGLPEFESTLAYGILAPRGTPAGVIEEIRAQTARVVATREYRERLEFEGALPLEGTPAEFAALIRAQGEKWGKLIRAAAIRPE